MDEVIEENKMLKEKVIELEERLQKYTNSIGHKKYYNKNKEKEKEESRLKEEYSKLKKENKILREGLMDMKRQVQEVLAAVYKKK
jgi:hypothetical protein